MQLRFLAPVEPTTGSSLAGIQGVRALAAVSILVSHAWQYSAPDGLRVDLGPLSRYAMPHLALGVTLLFVLSAFLLYRPFAAAIARGETPPPLGRYLRNRALRILPAYWVILLVTALLLQTALLRAADGSLSTGALTDPGHLLFAATFAHSLSPDTLLTGIGPAWALSVVVSFYLVLPLLVLLALRAGGRAATRRRRVAAALAPAALLAAVGAAGKTAAVALVPAGGWGGWGADWHSVLERSFFAHADMFALGLGLAVLLAECEDRRVRLPRWWRPVAFAALPALVFAGAKLGTDHLNATGQAGLAVYDVFTAAACALLVALVVLPAGAARRQPLLVRVLEHRVAVSLGVVSYSLFLWHEPLVRALQQHGLTLAGRGGFAVDVVVLLGVSFVLSTITYGYLERPALLRKSAPRSVDEAGVPAPTLP